MADPIRVQLLGPFEVWRGEARIPPAEWRGRESRFIHTRHEGYHFDLGAPAAVDLLDFERAAQAAARPGLEAALARYPGELLEEDPYADWAAPERARLQALRVELHARVADLALAEGDFAAARVAAEAALARDPSRESLWRTLMRAHALSGDRAAALRAFDRCRASLARDHGTDPLPETLGLHAQILRGE